MDQLRNDSLHVGSEATRLRDDLSKLRADVANQRVSPTDAAKDVVDVRFDLAQLGGDVGGVTGDVSAIRGQVREAGSGADSPGGPNAPYGPSSTDVIVQQAQLAAAAAHAQAAIYASDVTSGATEFSDIERQLQVQRAQQIS